MDVAVAVDILSLSSLIVAVSVTTTTALDGNVLGKMTATDPAQEATVHKLASHTLVSNNDIVRKSKGEEEEPSQFEEKLQSYVTDEGEDGHEREEANTVFANESI